jgi:hypothetical protein
MKKLIYIIISGLILLNSCKKGFLDEFPPQNITSGNYYQTEKQMVTAANSVYSQLYTIWGGGSLPYIYGDLYGGDSWLYLFVGTASDWEDLGNRKSLFPANGVITGAWKSSFSGIFKVNDFLAELEKFGDKFTTPGLGTRMKGEALFIRASFYYYLTECFGNVPLVNKVLTTTEAIDLTQETKANVVAKMIEDLQFAIANLPESYVAAEVGHITKYAAKAMLARVYMANKMNTEAKTQLKDIIDSGKYSLDTDNNGVTNPADWDNLFNVATKNTKESILENQYIKGVTGFYHDFAQQFSPRLSGFHFPGLTQSLEMWGNGAVRDSLYYEFEPTDIMRRDISAQMYVTIAGIPKYCPNTAKYYWKTAETLYIGSNVHVIRYAEVLLNYAELANDPSYLNMVRTRAGLPGWGQAGYPTAKYPTLALAIEHERRVELSFEFQRGFDLKRTGRLIDVVKKMTGITLTADRTLFPIPQSVLDVNTKIIPNKGY